MLAEIRSMLRRGAVREEILAALCGREGVVDLELKIVLTEIDLEARRRGFAHLLVGGALLLLGVLFCTGAMFNTPGWLAVPFYPVLLFGVAYTAFALRKILFGVYKQQFRYLIMPLVVTFAMSIALFFCWRLVGGRRFMKLSMFEFVETHVFGQPVSQVKNCETDDKLEV